ncbi:hypothetical protein jhhlp_001654 [Lomentospora prolificans]|uniref:NADP-dependent oxidoreductase domain-containing protein n=1 Tax=Lomentospora prolificans TaxID=41688 RepID=A0A2N3NIU9_9PEZI|nr:hypothetical protein jhhlp_001654 [Lomentospora prolificans]
MSAPTPADPPADSPVPAPVPAISSVFPALVLGTATFNHQYHPDPQSMPSNAIVARALSLGLYAFDTSPYYGPSEILLGAALTSALAANPVPRSSLFLITKAGRYGPTNFDYSPPSIRASVMRSLERLNTPYLDLVYCHDAEFVSPQDVLAAVGELRKLRDEGKIRYVGISGYPLPVLTSLTKLVLQETGEPLDAVQSYSNFNLQNTTLADDATLNAFRESKVSIVVNASILSMGLLTTRGIDASPMAVWHPAPSGLRKACTDLQHITEEAGFSLEDASIRWAIDSWAGAGAEFGTTKSPLGAGRLMGVTAIGVTSVDQLDATWRVWEEIVEEKKSEGAKSTASKTHAVKKLAQDRIWPTLGAWKDYTWDSPGEDYVPTGPSRPAE